MLLIIDNYDSFVYNLVQFLGELGAEPIVYRNDAITVEAAMQMHPDGIVISPGPGVPRDAGISIPLVRAAAGRVPILGVCLGHQAIGAAFGARVVRAERLMHGKMSAVTHTPGAALFEDLPDPLEAMRYHSLILDPGSVPQELHVTAWTTDNGRERREEIMAIVHREHAVFGVQFHPESIGTPLGKRLLANFLGRVRG